MSSTVFQKKRFRGAIPQEVIDALRGCAEEGLCLELAAVRLGTTPWRISGIAKKINIRFRDGRSRGGHVDADSIRAALLQAQIDGKTIREVSNDLGVAYARVYTVASRAEIKLRRDTFERNSPPRRPTATRAPPRATPTPEQRHWAAMKAHHTW